ncbi:MAG: thiamine diphosphokinase [Firmicutes bacterium]|nr:thiamine diphosphokinase [Bacillota bacterium]
MRAVIISGGSVTDYGYIKMFLRPGDLIVCADRGYDHARALGLVPDAVVGDLDSVSAIPEGEGMEVVRYPPEKDYTDTELAYEWARARGADEFLLLAATGTRLDHGLANILLLKRMLDRGERGELADEHNSVWLLSGGDSPDGGVPDRGTLTVSGSVGSLLSVVPLSNCSGVTLRGFQYPLNSAELKLGVARGVSNVITENPAEIRVKHGLILVIAARD